MSTQNMHGSGETAPLDAFKAALEKAAFGRSQKQEADFAEAYPSIEQHLARKVPVRVVIETFSNAYGYNLHAPRFRKLLEAERRRRSESGEVATCPACHQQLTSAKREPQGENTGGDDQ